MPTSAGATSLYVAYVEIAVHNSVVAIEGQFEPYEYSVPAPKDASPEAAAVEAAYRMLLHQLPDRASDAQGGSMPDQQPIENSPSAAALPCSPRMATLNKRMSTPF